MTVNTVLTAISALDSPVMNHAWIAVGRFAGIAATILLVAGACTSNDEGQTEAGHGKAVEGEPEDVRFVAVDYAYTEAPQEIRAGVINLTFENRGTVGHEATLTGIGDTPIPQFVDDLAGRGGLENSAFPSYIDQVAVPPFVSAKGGQTREATYTLTPGRYALWCSITDVAEGDEKAPHYQLGMMRELTVTDGGDQPRLPPADGTITARDYAFDIDLEAGDRSLNFINDGPDQIHFSTVEVYPKGVDAEEAERAYSAQLASGPTPEGVPSPKGLGFSGTFSAGLGSQFRLFRGAFESGRTYVFACYISDRGGGKPHAIAYNMFKVVTIE